MIWWPNLCKSVELTGCEDEPEYKYKYLNLNKHLYVKYLNWDLVAVEGVAGVVREPGDLLPRPALLHPPHLRARLLRLADRVQVVEPVHPPPMARQVQIFFNTLVDIFTDNNQKFSSAWPSWWSASWRVTKSGSGWCGGTSSATCCSATAWPPGGGGGRFYNHGRRKPLIRPSPC